MKQLNYELDIIIKRFQNSNEPSELLCQSSLFIRLRNCHSCVNYSTAYCDAWVSFKLKQDERDSFDKSHSLDLTVQNRSILFIIKLQVKEQDYLKEI